jgi:membrane associated rhomboid family serine protease
MALSREAVRQGKYYVFLTAGFSHTNFQHIFLNTIWFYMFGKYIQFQQSILFNILLILTTCIGGTIASFFFTLSSPLVTYSHGLSGVVYGLVGYAVINSLFVLYTFRYDRIEKSLLCDDCRAMHEIKVILNKTEGRSIEVDLCDECSPWISSNIYCQLIACGLNIVFFTMAGWSIVSMFMEYNTKGIDFYCHCGGLAVGVLFSVFKNLFSLVQQREDN